MKSIMPILLVGACAATAHGHIFEVVFGMRGSNVVPASGSDAQATGRLRYNHHTFRYDIDLVVTGIELNDLLGTGPNNSPLHIYHGQRGQNGDIVLDPSFFADFYQDGDNIRFTATSLQVGGSQGAFSSNIFTNEGYLYDGQLYVQLYTAQNPNGDIRGMIPPVQKQLKSDGIEDFVSPIGPPSPIPSPGTPLALAAIGLAAMRRRR